MLAYEGGGTGTNRFLMAALRPAQAVRVRGSVIGVSGEPGYEVVATINAYDEYGIPAPTNVGRFGYTGQIWLPELKLWYYKARTYSPTLGRFLQTDPIGYADGMNWYNYVGSDPVNFVDPLGLCVLESAPGLDEQPCYDPRRFGPEDWYRIAGFGDDIVVTGSRFSKPSKASVGEACGPGGAFLAPPLVKATESTVGGKIKAGAARIFGPLVIRVLSPLAVLSLSGDTPRPSTPIYRSVGPRELASIQATNQFSLSPSGFGVKQFWTSQEAAELYGQKVLKAGWSSSQTIVQTLISISTYGMGEKMMLDGQEAISFDPAGLQAVNQDARKSKIRILDQCAP